MAHRKTMDSTMFEKTNSPIGVSSPLHRRSLAARTPNTITQNNDEAERINRRKQPLAVENLRNGENSSRRVSLGLVSTLSANEIMEHYNKCVKLCAENKITVKNAFTLSVIDYMTVLNKQDQNSNNMQTAGTTLDISTKIYGVRVDCVYTDVFKMAGDSTKNLKKKDDQQNVEQEIDNSGAAEDVETRRKKKKRSQKILTSIESLAGTIEVSNLSSITNTSDAQTTDQLFQVTYAVHATSGYNLHLYEDVLLDSVPTETDEVEKSSQQVPVPAVEDFSQLDICPMFADFHFLGWSEADIPESPPRNESPTDDNLRFVMDMSIGETCESQNSGLNYFDLNDASQEDVNRCMRVPDTVEHIVDFSHSVAPRIEDKEKTLEYSYLQKGLKTIHWAGPIHWKPKIFSKVTKVGQNAGTSRQEGGRPKKVVEVSEFSREVSEAIFDKFSRKTRSGLKINTLKKSWEEEKLTLPEDVRYEGNNQTEFYHYSFRTIPLLPVKASEEATSGEAGPDALVDEDNVDYNYDNLNDTQNYCSPDSDGGNVEEENNENVFPNQEQDHDQNPDGDICTQALTGENLVAVPKLTTQVQIQYSTRAKKIDMRQLKRSIWKSLVHRNIDEEEMQVSEGNNDKMKQPRDFGSIYKKLPNILGRDNAEALSPALAFVSLLHLANEKTLRITSALDMSNLAITQD